ncbi:MAG: GH25 family lysozyme [Eubacteriales bacterium]
MKRGIDVSVFQSGINWEKVRASGVDFAMIKATQGRSEQNASLRLFTDSFFIRNMIGAQKSGIRIGVYHFLTAQTVTEAIEEADYYLSAITPYKSAVSLYAAVDVESKYLPDDKSMLTMIINAFCKRVQSAGYTPMVYTNPDFLKNRIGDISVWPLWLALWRDKKYVPSKTDYPNIRIWQWGSEAVDGIGGYVDANYEIQEKTEQAEAVEQKNEEEKTDMEKNEIVSEWAKDAMDWAVKMGFIKGDENGNLMPKDPITREQFCVVLKRIMQHISGM